MSAAIRARAKEIFADALAMAPAERGAFLDQACEGDTRLRAVVDGLLAAMQSASDFLAEPTVDGDASALGSSAVGPGEVIGRYRLLRALGEGGFGIVYLAEQQRPVTRRVALKILKVGMDTKRVVARFEAERQALALMDHPCIASVLDAGATESGRPYFVMEYVQGEPITTWCIRKRLGVEARLRLFERVCLAVQHAHQKGVLHRDLKPSNVLVTQVDGEATPKVIDFGVAKAIEGRLSDQTIVTEERSLIGTPAYMSPEQASMSPGSVDTRSDVYSLGVLLYEMLAARPPFDQQRLRDASFSEFQRILAEEEPPRPSTRMGETGGAGADAAASHEARRLRQRVRGELDWIVMRALEKDRARRYQSAGALAAEIRRFLEGDAVEAGPPTARYRAWKLAKRHRVVFGAAAVVVSALLVGAVAASAGLVEARRANRQLDDALHLARVERDRAVEAERLADEEAERARRQAAIASAVNDFLNDDLLGAVSPDEQGRDVTMRAALDAAIARLDEASGPEGALAETPEVECALRTTIGATLRSLGDYEASGAHLVRGHELASSIYGAESAAAIGALVELAQLRRLEGRHAEALAMFEQAFAAEEARPSPDPEELTTAQANIAVVLFDLGRFEEAASMMEQVLAARRERRGPDHPDTLSTQNNLATTLMNLGRLDESAAMLEQTVEGRRRALGAAHPRTLVSMNNLGQVYRRLGRVAEAAAIYEESLAGKRIAFGPDHPETLTTINNLSLALLDLERYDEAEAMLEELLSTQRRVLGDTHWQTCSTMINLARVYKGREQWARAEPLNREAVAGGRVSLPAGHWMLGVFIGHLGVTLVELERYEEAEATLLEAHAMLVESMGPGHVRTVAQVEQLVTLYRRWGRDEDAAEWMRRVGGAPGTP